MICFPGDCIGCHEGGWRCFRIPTFHLALPRRWPLSMFWSPPSPPHDLERLVPPKVAACLLPLRSFNPAKSSGNNCHLIGFADGVFAISKARTSTPTHRGGPSIWIITRAERRRLRPCPTAKTLIRVAEPTGRTRPTTSTLFTAAGHTKPAGYCRSAHRSRFTPVCRFFFAPESPVMPSHRRCRPASG